MNMGPAQLLAATSYAVDLTLDSCRFHGWRTAMLAYNMAKAVDPTIARDIFYAGLMHDVAAPGVAHHVFDDAYVPSDTEANLIYSHPAHGAALLRWLPGLDRAAEYVASHHEYWGGGGYPHGLSGTEIPIGAQILCMADTAESVGCFRPDSRLADKLHTLAAYTGQLWSREVWAALVGCVRSGELYRTLVRVSTDRKIMQVYLREVSVPEELENQEGIERVLHILPAIVDKKDSTTAGHSLRTANYAKQLASAVGLPRDERKLVYSAGLIHDCGRLGLPPSLLNQSGRLDDRALQTVRRHASMTIRTMSCLPECREMVYLGYIGGHDHERYDGKGYPDRLHGEDIPPLTRILSVADAYDAMVTPRDYRLLSPRAAVLRLQQGAGTQFDPVIVDAMVSAVDSGDILPGDQNAA